MGGWRDEPMILTRGDGGNPAKTQDGYVLSLVIGGQLEHFELLIWRSPLGRPGTMNAHTSHMIVPIKRLSLLDQALLTCDFAGISAVRCCRILQKDLMRRFPINVKMRVLRPHFVRDQQYALGFSYNEG